MRTMKYQRTGLFLFLLLCASWGEAFGVSGHLLSNRLFREGFGPVASTGSQKSRETSPEIRRSRSVQINLDLLSTFKSPASGALKGPMILNLFDNLSFTAIHDRVEIRSPGRYTWYGHIEGIAQSHVILVVEEGSVAGRIFVRPNEAYEIRDLSEGGQVVYDINSAANSPHAHPVPIHENDPPAQAFQPPVEGADDGSILDVMVVYTAAAAAASANIVAAIQLGIDTTNTAYGNSLIDQRVRLVHTASVTYTETGDAITDLERLRRTSDGYMDDVHTLRDTYGADLVCLITNTLDAGGIGYVMQTVSNSFKRYGFNVVKRSAITTAFPHELGHNMGAMHDRANSDIEGAYSYSYGHYDTTLGFGTIMSYLGFDIPYFSNPLVTYLGSPTGIAEGDPNSADNAKTFNNTAVTVAGFRQSVTTTTTSTISPTTTTTTTTTMISPTTTTTTTTTMISPTTTTTTTTTTLPMIMCNGLPATIIGTSGNDTINGTPGVDVIVGLGGNDKINGKGGNDIICGGDGRDRLYGDDGNDILFGEDGKDSLKGGNGDDTLSGGGENDSLSGGSGNDALNGGADRDRCSGGSGTDTATDCERTSSIP